MRKPGAFEMERLGTGEVGYLVCGVKNVLDARVGDTITNAKEREDDGVCTVVCIFRYTIKCLHTNIFMYVDEIIGRNRSSGTRVVGFEERCCGEVTVKGWLCFPQRLEASNGFV